jgi:hypothetical protein
VPTGCGCLVVLVLGVLLTPPVPLKGLLLGFLRSGFLWFVGTVGGRSFVGVVLAAVLGELPALAFEIELVAVMAGLFVFPMVLTERTFDKELLTFTSELRAILGARPPELNVYKRGDLAFLVVDSIGFVDGEREVSNRGPFGCEAHFRIVDQVADDFDVVEYHNLIRSMLDLGSLED